MNKTKIKNIFLIMFIAFMILQPILDIFYLYTDSIINIFKFSPSTILRMIVMGLLFITSFFWFKSKNKYKYSIIFGIIFIVYAFLHHYNSLLFHSEYGNYSYSTIKDFENALEDIEIALNLQPLLIEWVVSDDDFILLRDKERYRQIVKNYTLN